MMEVTASALDGQRFLHGLWAEQLDALAATTSEVAFAAGHRIFAEGGPVASFWLIESGCVALGVPVPGERPVIIGTVGIGGLWAGPGSFPRTSGRSAPCASPRSGRSNSERRPSGTAAPPTRTSDTSSPSECSRYSPDDCATPGPG
jgi:CRP-like cAMP-binding protein